MPVASLIQASVSGSAQNALMAQGDGLILPKLSSAQRTALVLTTGDAGLEVYDTTAGNIYLWDGTTWVFPSVIYSQGIWLGSFVSAVGTVTENPAVKTGYWSRIGNTVTISMQIAVQSVAGQSGLLQLITLPFPAVQPTALAVHGDLLMVNSKTALAGYATNFNVNLYHFENGTLDPFAQHVKAGSILYISGSYITP